MSTPLRPDFAISLLHDTRNRAFTAAATVLVIVALQMTLPTRISAQSSTTQTGPGDRAVIVLERAVGPSEVIAELAAKSPAAARAIAQGFHHFGTARPEHPGEPQTLTFRFQQATTLTSLTTSADFQVKGGSCAEGRAYLPGERCTVDLVFTPRGPGNRTGKLILSHSASTRPFTVPMGGVGQAPALSFIPSQITTVPSTTVNGDGTGVGIFGNPQAMAMDGGDQLYIADLLQNVVHTIDINGVVSTVIGGGQSSPFFYNDVPTDIILNGPQGLATDLLGNLYVADTLDRLVLQYDASGVIYPIVGGGGQSFDTCSYLDPCPQPSNLVITLPTNLATDSSGNLFGNMLDLASPFLTPFEYTYTTFSQTPGLFWNLVSREGNSYSNAIAVDRFDNVYYGKDFANGPVNTCAIWAQDPNFGNYIVSPSKPARTWNVAGGHKCGYAGDNVPAVGALLQGEVGGMTFDAAGNLYFTDSGNRRVRRIDALTGIIHTLAGNGDNVGSGDGGPSTAAGLATPIGIAVDSQGNVYATNETDDSNSTTSIRVFGTVGEAAFPAQTVAQPSPDLKVLLTNTGNVPLKFLHTAITGTNAAEFAIDPLTTNCDFSAGLDSGKVCQINFRFTPAALGPRSASLVLADNTPGAVHQVLLSGTGATPAKPVVSPTALAFASHFLSVPYPAKTVTLSNSGGVPFVIQAITLSGSGAAAYSQTNTCGLSLAAGANCTFSLLYFPTVLGASPAALNVVTSVGPVAVALTGTSITPTPAKVSLTPTTLAFGDQGVMLTSNALTLTVKNVGGTPMAVTAVTFAGTNSTDFSLIGNGCMGTVAALSNCQLQLVFTPAATGARTTRVNVFTSGGNVQAVLTGTGIAAAKPKVTLASKVNPAPKGKPVALKSQVVSSISAGATGKVQLREGSKVIASAVLKASAANFSLTGLTTGTHTLIAHYLGDAHHPASESAPLKQVVTAAP